VLGATGHIGQAVVRNALERGRQVTATTRQADPPALRGLDVSVVRLDDSYTGLKDIAANHDVVVDAAAPYPLDPCVPGGAAWQEAVQRAVWRTWQVLNAAREHRLRLVFISAFTTLPRTESPLRACETACRRAPYPYFAAKAAMEHAVVEAARQGLPAVIINPAASFGPWEFRGDDSSFVGLVLNRRLPMIMDQDLSVIDVRDVAEAIDRALQLEFFGYPIPLAGHNVNLVDLARQILDLGGITGSWPLPIDSTFASIAAFWTSVASAAFNQSTPDLWRAVSLITDAFPMYLSPEQIAMRLDPRPLSDTLRDSIAFRRSWRGFGVR
jgi:dihydroflavonol-4-reductase